MNHIFFAYAACSNCYEASEESCIKGAAGFRKVIAKAKAKGWIVVKGEIFCSQKCADEHAAQVQKIREQFAIKKAAQQEPR